MSRSLAYRRDIDGLRAVAVSAVVAYHLGLGLFGGGFVGVDIFFTISGFLIGAIISTQLREGSFSFAQFYVKRIRRLFPAAAAMTALSFLAAYALLLPGDFRAFGKSVIATMGYLSNVQFYRETGYFDHSSELKPLLHTWSLSVEEQFYIVFPLMAFLLRARINMKIAVFAAISASSFLASVLWLPRDASAVFYLFPFRAWEMLIGCTYAAIVVGREGRAFPGWSTSDAVALCGLGMIAVPIVFYTAATPFPARNALLPCLGTLVLLHAGAREAGAVHAVLASRPVVFVGKISYSLYLWHWPLIALNKYRTGESPSGSDVLWLALAMLIVATLSYRLIETPWRESSRSRDAAGRWATAKVFGTTALASSTLAAAAFAVYFTDGLPARLDGPASRFSQAASDFFLDASHCHSADDVVGHGLDYCAVGRSDPDVPLTVMWGDSHALALKPGFLETMHDARRNAIVFWSAGCPPLLGVDKSENSSSSAENERCRPHNEAVLRFLAERRGPTSIVLVGRWAYYTSGHGIGLDAHNQVTVRTDLDRTMADASQADRVMASLAATSAALHRRGLAVYLLQQVPEFPAYDASKIGRLLQSGRLTLRAVIAERAAVTAVEVAQRQAPFDRLVAEPVAARAFTVLTTHTIFCGPAECSAMLDDRAAYFDTNHVTATTSRRMATVYRPLIPVEVPASISALPPTALR